MESNSRLTGSRLNFSTNFQIYRALLGSEHDARHSAASILLAQGIQPKVVSEILGHSGIRVTLDTYGHVYQQARDQAAEAMETAVFGL